MRNWMVRICVMLFMTPVLAYAQDPIKIAVIMAKTGDAASVNQLGFDGARFAAAEINQGGGILGRHVRLIEIDNESTALGSRKAAKQAVASGVVAVVGASWSSHSIPIADVLQAAGIPMISPASTSPALTKIGNYIFRVCFTDDFQGEAMADFALTRLSARTGAVLTNIDNKYSVGLANRFVARFGAEGRLVFKGEYLHSTTDFLPQLKQIQKTAPDIVFVPGYPRDAGLLIKQARKFGIKSVFLGGDGWDDKMYDFAGSDLDGNYFTEHWHYRSSNPKSLVFVETYESRMGRVRTGLVALTYDAVMLFADAAQRAKSFAPAAIRDAIAATRHFDGVTGAIHFDPNGDPVKPAVVLQFKNGESVFVDAIEPQKKN